MLVNLKQIRLKEGLYLKDLSKMTSISKTYLNDLENLYRINPSDNKKDKIANALNTTIKELEGR